VAGGHLTEFNLFINIILMYFTRCFNNFTFKVNFTGSFGDAANLLI